MSYLMILPLSAVILCVTCFCLSYVIAVVMGDVSAVFPYLSDTGARIPESCVFGLLLNLAAFAIFFTMFVRFKSVKTLVSDDHFLVHRLNKAALFVGLFSCLGLFTVANFQEADVVLDIHILGANVTFFGGIVYCFMQSVMTYRMIPFYNGRCICHLRLAISLLSASCLTISILAGFIFASIADTDVKHFKNSDKDRFKWKPGQPGFLPHVVSTAGEWMMAISFLTFFLTYVEEFRSYELEIVTRVLIEDGPLMVTPEDNSPLLSPH